MKNNWMKKGLVVSVIFLFIGVAIAPSINFNVVKASDDNDLVEVTSQACGIQGFGNTTVKLAKQQYQNLEQYLVDFRARLNQTTTREEAVPLFKEAVVELNKYGLLPKGMSTDKAQKLVLGGYQNPLYTRLLDKLQNSYGKSYGDYENYYCLIAGHTTNTVSRGIIASIIRIITIILFSLYESSFFSFLLTFGLGNVISNLNPILILSLIGIGGVSEGLGYWQYLPANGWIFTIGLNGVKIWGGNFYGAIDNYEYYAIYWFNVIGFFPGILRFSGIKIIFPKDLGNLELNSFYLGTAFEIKVTVS